MEREDFGLSGVWRREGRSLGAARAKEPSLVVWVQVGPWFADVRVPRSARTRAANGPPGELDRVQAFSGRVERDGARMRFVHDLDTLDRSSPDEAVLEWHDDLLWESGVGYVEHWRRVVDLDVAARRGPVGVVERLSCAGGGQPPTVTARVVQVADVSAAAWCLPAPGGALLQRATYRARRWPRAPWRAVATAGDQTGATVVAEALAQLR